MKNTIIPIVLSCCIVAYSIKLNNVRKERDDLKQELKELKERYESTDSN